MAMTVGRVVGSVHPAPLTRDQRAYMYRGPVAVAPAPVLWHAFGRHKADLAPAEKSPGPESIGLAHVDVRRDKNEFKIRPDWGTGPAPGGIAHGTQLAPHGRALSAALPSACQWRHCAHW